MELSKLKDSNPEAERLVSASGLRVSSYSRIQKKILKTRRQLV